MNAVKIVRLLAILLAVVAAFATVPYAALGLAILGLANGFMGVSEDRRIIYLVTAIAVAASTDALASIPAIGGYITAIMGNISAVLNAGVIAVFVMIAKDRLTE
ncbi:MAG: hypothetical protein GTN86_06185 [Xanthomonadales bacterium]|nr:hypothetical protein [Xanthomonadales bacterium]NIN59557.1 hypothetical protein [Xanthomonadales bacterium]NIN74923.1 hypothetical protein [Xanthomonadales bacterium]NIO14065.1 hypothetical protein [Xanthomonadales bacterium]NIP11950.1 hypothetical protein [Xanthomonadales bacterium]